LSNKEPSSSVNTPLAIKALTISLVEHENLIYLNVFK